MLETRKLGRWAVLGVATTLSMVASQAGATLINGDFETGDLTGWTTFTTASGTLGDGFPQVTSFDTNNDSVASNSATFRVGRVSGTGAGEGGGLMQSVLLSEGIYSLSADIAILDDVGTDNSSGGFFELLFDGIVVHSHDFGTAILNVAEYSMLANVAVTTAGFHDVAIRMTRTFEQGDPSPRQYIDNVSITQPIPEPATMLLLGMGVSALAVRNRRKRNVA